MMRAQVESYHSAIGEMTPLYPLQWGELRPVDADYAQCRLAPRYEIYDLLAKRDELALVTLRDDNNILVGYCLCFVGPDMHARHCIRAAMDAFYVHPLARGRFGGVRLLRAMREELRYRGVHRWAGSEIFGKGNGMGRLLELSGFSISEIGYSQWLGAES